MPKLKARYGYGGIKYIWWATTIVKETNMASHYECPLFRGGSKNLIESEHFFISNLNRNNININIYINIVW